MGLFQFFQSKKESEHQAERSTVYRPFLPPLAFLKFYDFERFGNCAEISYANASKLYCTAADVIDLADMMAQNERYYMQNMVKDIGWKTLVQLFNNVYMFNPYTRLLQRAYLTIGEFFQVFDALRSNPIAMAKAEQCSEVILLENAGQLVSFYGNYTNYIRKVLTKQEDPRPFQKELEYFFDKEDKELELKTGYNDCMDYNPELYKKVQPQPFFQIEDSNLKYITLNDRYDYLFKYHQLDVLDVNDLYDAAPQFRDILLHSPLKLQQVGDDEHPVFHKTLVMDCYSIKKRNLHFIKWWEHPSYEAFVNFFACRTAYYLNQPEGYKWTILVEDIRTFYPFKSLIIDRIQDPNIDPSIFPEGEPGNTVWEYPKHLIYADEYKKRRELEDSLLLR